MIGMFIEVKAFIVVLLSIGISILIYFNVKHNKEKLIKISSFSQILIFVFSLIYMTVILSKLDDIGKLGEHLSVFINSNLYISIVALGQYPPLPNQ